MNPIDIQKIINTYFENLYANMIKIQNIWIDP